MRPDLGHLRCSAQLWGCPLNPKPQSPYRTLMETAIGSSYVGLGVSSALGRICLGLRFWVSAAPTVRLHTCPGLVV